MAERSIPTRAFRKRSRLREHLHFDECTISGGRRVAAVTTSWSRCEGRQQFAPRLTSRLTVPQSPRSQTAPFFSSSEVFSASKHLLNCSRSLSFACRVDTNSKGSPMIAFPSSATPHCPSTAVASQHERVTKTGMGSRGRQLVEVANQQLNLKQFPIVERF